MDTAPCCCRWWRAQLAATDPGFGTAPKALWQREKPGPRSRVDRALQSHMSVRGSDPVSGSPFTTFQINGVDAGFNTHLRIGKKQMIEPDHFSKGDLRSGPGYLVAAGHLQYQRDHGKVMQDFGPLNP